MDIHLNWSGPFSLKEAKEAQCSEALGLYQYVGMHHIYGPDSLLYLGKASANYIKYRLENRNLELYSSLPTTVYVLIGKVRSDSPLSEEQLKLPIELAEELLIFSHSPPWNSQNITGVDEAKFAKHNPHVFNWGARGRLLPEVSYERFSGYGNALPDRYK